MPARAETHTEIEKIRTHRIFLLSPANAAGIRARLLMRDGAHSEIAHRLRNGGASLGEVFTFMSSLYFRGKLAYARAFAAAPPKLHGTFVITSSGGLVPPDTLVTLETLRAISSANIDASNIGYREPLERDVRTLAEAAGRNCEIVLLGSIATAKYVEPLLHILGETLVFPAEFVGRGDMSRGGLLLRCAQSGTPLSYIPVREAQRHGKRPPKLEPM